MGYSFDIDRESATRRKVYGYISQPMRNSLLKAEGQIRANVIHLVKVTNAISDYYAPLKNSNNTGLHSDELTEYVSFLESKNKNLSMRVAELEFRFKAIERYVPTMLKIVEAYSTGASRIEEKKKLLASKYSLHKISDMKLWSGAQEKADIADVTLDDMLDSIEE